MATLTDIFDDDALSAAIDGGYVRSQRHPTLHAALAAPPRVNREGIVVWFRTPTSA